MSALTYVRNGSCNALTAPPRAGTQLGALAIAGIAEQWSTTPMDS